MTFKSEHNDGRDGWLSPDPTLSGESVSIQRFPDKIPFPAPTRPGSPLASSTTSTSFDESSSNDASPTTKLNEPSRMPFVVLRSELERYFVKDESLNRLNSIVGKKKRYAGGKLRVIDPVNEDDLKRAIQLHIPIVKIAHMPRTWLKWPDPKVVQIAQPVLYNPRTPALACETCVERGFLCASLRPEQACSVCFLEGIECKPHDCEDDDDRPIVSIPLVPSDDSDAAIALHAATADLAERINRSLAKQFRREQRNSGKPRPVHDSHRVTYEPSKVIFDELQRTKKERWARFGWMNGVIYYYGDPSIPHENTISILWDSVRANLVQALQDTPRLPRPLESMMLQYAKEEKMAVKILRGERLFRLLFTGGLSSAVEGLDGSLLETPRKAKRRSRRLRKAKKSSTKKTMVKEADFLLLFRNPMTKATIPIAAEVAYCNESLKTTMKESLLWKGKAIVSLALKIDQRVKSQRKSRRADRDGTSPIDPMMTLFLVRGVEEDIDGDQWEDGLVKLQLPFGKGSGVAAPQTTRIDLEDDSECSSLLTKAVNDVDWNGEANINDVTWSRTFEGFQLQQARDVVDIPLKTILQQAFDRLLGKKRYQDRPWAAARQPALDKFINDSYLRLDLSEVRGSIIRACWCEFEDSLSTDPYDHPPLESPNLDDIPYPDSPSASEEPSSPVTRSTSGHGLGLGLP